jgi:hypothetical protein
MKPLHGKTYDFFSDPGHGWVKVNRNELLGLGIANKISSYSRQRKNAVFLEEDNDASEFMRAKQARGEPVKFREHISDKQSKIRNYPGFALDRG